MTNETQTEKRWNDLKEWLKDAVRDCNKKNCIKCSYGKQLIKTMNEMEQGLHSR